jgi:hypothetical protein
LIKLKVISQMLQAPEKAVTYTFGIDVGCVNFAYCILGSDGSIPRWGKRYICGGKTGYEEMYDGLRQFVTYITEVTEPPMVEHVEIEGQITKRMIAIQSYLYAAFHPHARLISPTKWRRELGLSQGQYALNKASSLVVMRDIMIEWGVDPSDDDKAEAFLIAFRKLWDMGFFQDGQDPWRLLERLPVTANNPRKRKRVEFQAEETGPPKSPKPILRKTTPPPGKRRRVVAKRKVAN